MALFKLRGVSSLWSIYFDVVSVRDGEGRAGKPGPYTLSTALLLLRQVL
ncbi:hypothetical protein Ptr902_10324 [Pyrenophora tritici-repentis]|uniref:Uncharacterized protein n=1 Tax=Pyrenophora tritici-repentis TaxID=45151 RepID=A0A834RMJ1_9PLEO|nr:hypothetical protein PtrM4_146460 [Pyrenophora tritici-repentis]KAI2478129.1 hypothetical protein Ptr902_10324 [Pyrenophora tritici-repentis]